VKAKITSYPPLSSSDEVTETLNRAVDEIGEEKDPLVAAAARRILEKTEW